MSKVRAKALYKMRFGGLDIQKRLSNMYDSTFFIFSSNHVAWESANKIEMMKTFKLLSVCFLSALLCISCKKDDGTDDALSLSTNELHFTRMASSKIVTIISTDVWMAETPANWITLSSEAGKGKTELLITVKENTSNTSRESYIKIFSSNESKLILVSQSALASTSDDTDSKIDVNLIIGDWNYGNQYINILKNSDEWNSNSGKGYIVTLSGNALSGSEITWALNHTALYINDTLTLEITDISAEKLIVTCNGKTREYVKNPSDEFIKSHIVGRWHAGTLWEVYNSSGSGCTWDTADDVVEDEAQTYTWTVTGNILTQYHQMESSSGVVPKQYIITTLNETTIVYCTAGGKRFIFSKQ